MKKILTIMAMGVLLPSLFSGSPQSVGAYEQGVAAKQVLSFVTRIELGLTTCQPSPAIQQVCYGIGGFVADAEAALRGRTSRFISEINTIQSGNVCLMSDNILIEDSIQRAYKNLATSGLSCSFAEASQFFGDCSLVIPGTIRADVEAGLVPGVSNAQEYVLTALSLAEIMKEHLEQFGSSSPDVGAQAFASALQGLPPERAIYDLYWQDFYGYRRDGYRFAEPYFGFENITNFATETYENDEACGDPLFESTSEAFTRLLEGVELLQQTGIDLYRLGRAFFKGEPRNDRGLAVRTLDPIASAEVQSLQNGARNRARRQIQKLFRDSLDAIGGGLLYVDRSEQNWINSLIDLRKEDVEELVSALMDSYEGEAEEAEQQAIDGCMDPLQTRSRALRCQNIIIQQFRGSIEFRREASLLKLIIEQLDIALARQALDSVAGSAEETDETSEYLSELLEAMEDYMERMGG